MTITIELSAEVEQGLKKLAGEAGMTTDQLAHEILKARVLYPTDKEFQAAVDRVLKRNAELYRRLA